MWLQFVQYDFQHDLAWVTDEADCSIVLALLQVAFLGKFDDSDKVGADVVLLQGCPQSCIPNAVEGLPKVYEDMVAVLLVLETFLTLGFLG